MENKYSVEIKWSEEDNCFIIFSKELPGCVAHGNTQEEAIKEFQYAKEGWLEVAQEDNVKVMKPIYFKQKDIS